MDASLILSLGTAIIGFVGVIFVMRYMVSELKRNQDTLFERLEKHGDDIVKLNSRAEFAVTAKDVDEKFVSKEFFRQFEKHIDKRFDSLEIGQGKILSYIKDGK